MEDDDQYHHHNDHHQGQDNSNSTTTQQDQLRGGGSSSSGCSSTTEPVRSRWSPKPEQILILESIFNSGMVNPPKDETVRIRKVLEKFGSVGDANVFYWFQNRRSRSRRRQRQIQAGLAGTSTHPTTAASSPSAKPAAAAAAGFLPLSPIVSVAPSLVGSSSSFSSSRGAVAGGGSGVVDLFSFSGQTMMSFPDNSSCTMSSISFPSDTEDLHYQTGGIITVFINGVATEVARGPIDIKAMFGDEVVLVHSSGLPVPVHDFGGCTLQSLHHGESYFLVSRPS